MLVLFWPSKKFFSEYNSSCSSSITQKIKIKNPKKIKGDESQERNQTQGPGGNAQPEHQKIEAKIKALPKKIEDPVEETEKEQNTEPIN